MQKITPFLWFEDHAEEAMKFYVSVFDDSKIHHIQRYPEGISEGPMAGFDGKVLTGVFQLEGQRFMALDGGPVFKFNPTVSFIINCTSVEEVDRYWNALLPGGSVLMPLQQWPFSERYGWLNDAYGVSWQIGMVTGSPKEKITPSLMFVGDLFGKAEEAINAYVSIFRNSSVEVISRYEPGEHDETGKVKFASFVLEGQQFRAMESSQGHSFKTGGAISFLIECQNQEEIDYYWARLTEGGDPAAQQCGWLKDQYGFSWQVVPDMTQWLQGSDKQGSARAMQAMLQMKKIDIATLQGAYDGR